MSYSDIKGVYCLTFPNGKKYVGVGTGKGGIPDRFTKYRNVKCDRQVKLKAALIKYGPENVKYEIVFRTDDHERARRVERQLIALWGTQRLGYNITDGGEGCPGRKLSDETKSKIGSANAGKVRTQEQKDHLSKVLTGRQISQESREKAAAKLRGRRRPAHVIAAVAAAHRGTKMPEHVRQAIIAANTGRKLSPETVEKMRANALKRGPMSPETREKMRIIALNRKPMSAETRNKMSESAKKRSRNKKEHNEQAK